MLTTDAAVYRIHAIASFVRLRLHAGRTSFLFDKVNTCWLSVAWCKLWVSSLYTRRLALPAAT
jgi:hypothetical protein